MSDFWKNKKVFITGNTGFKGSWLMLWLLELGADVTGFSLEPPTNPSLFNLCDLRNEAQTFINDIRDFETLSAALKKADPDIIIHMAAQPLVRESYINPLETYEINVMGTVNLLESVRLLNRGNTSKKRVIVNVTTDKCYENQEWHWGYRENEPMGGYDPYSNSKACSELVTSAYRSSFFNSVEVNNHGILLASARAGNVIGGGDWAKDRLIPDCMQALLFDETIIVRNPLSIRPWQHVLEPLSGYLLLAQTLYEKENGEFAEGWNFGPNDEDSRNVEWIVQTICSYWGNSARYTVENDQFKVHEAKYLKLDCSKAKMELGWKPRWSLERSLHSIVDWIKTYKENDEGIIKEICRAQINEYSSTLI
ncbi:CDP-glucose 4,6-dehydratase [Paenibacillus vini]|uniref:CDP-glucose 4,6-dehydratase n=1 Tax=Paenibacillus vini TaxID=1476024 RepID=UPI00338E66C6